MRIAMVSEHASPLATIGGRNAGGQNVHVAALARALATRGHEVVVHTRRDDPDLPRRVRMAPNVVVDHVDAGPPEAIAMDDLLPYMDDFAADLRTQWLADRPDVVHAHFWMSGMASLAAAWPLGVPVVQTFHAHGWVKRREQGDKDTSPPERIEVERRIIRRVDHIVAQCTDEVFELRHQGAEMHKISVIPSGIDLDHFRPDGPAAPRRPGVPRVLVVSRLVERKGIGNVITALAEVPQAELIIAGGPPAQDLERDAEACRLQALARAHGVADRVELLGRVSRADLPALFRSADVVVCAPWYEPFGIVPLEAMACGVPVVASAVGGLIDTVVDGVTGVHVPPRRPDLIAVALRELLDDPDRLQAYGRAAAARARSRYSWTRTARLVSDLYRSVALQPASSSRWSRT